MVVERYTAGAGPVYERVAMKGRMLPGGVRYVDSWVDSTLERCFQLMDTDDPALLDTWMQLWVDLVEFEVFPVIKSDHAATLAGQQ